MVHTTGMLSEGITPYLYCSCSKKLTKVLDGIHIDMDHLKKGEVKYGSPSYLFRFQS